MKILVPRGRRRGPRVDARPSLATNGRRRSNGNDWLASLDYGLLSEADPLGTHPSRWYL